MGKSFQSLFGKLKFTALYLSNKLNFRTRLRDKIPLACTIAFHIIPAKKSNALSIIINHSDTRCKNTMAKEGDGEEIVFDQVTIYEIHNEIRKGE